MIISNLNIKDKSSLVILGAGATRGASCFEDGGFSAPLDTDFFDICQRLSVFEPDLEKLLDFVRTEFSPLINIRMEQFFTAIESLDQFYDVTKITAGPTVKQYRKLLSDYPNHIASVFRVLKDKVKSRTLSCDHHDKIATTLSGKDSIISFNYDCIIDESLKKISKKRWNPKKGYGVEISQGIDFWKNHTGKGKVAKEGILLLKLHGSLNWNRHNPNEIHLREKPYQKHTRAKDELIPPVWNKRISSDKLLQDIWKKSRQNLKSAKVLAFIGYSIPETDLFTQSLLKVSAMERTDKEKIENVIIVNPDPNVAEKVLNLLGKSIDKNSKIHRFQYLKDFANLI